MADAGEGHVGAGHQRAVGGEHVEEPRAGFRRLRRVGVEDEAGLGMGELDRRGVDRVAEDEDLALARAQAEAGVADGVAGQRQAGMPGMTSPSAPNGTTRSP